MKPLIRTKQVDNKGRYAYIIGADGAIEIGIKLYPKPYPHKRKLYITVTYQAINSLNCYIKSKLRLHKKELKLYKEQMEQFLAQCKTHRFVSKNMLVNNSTLKPREILSITLNEMIDELRKERETVSHERYQTTLGTRPNRFLQ